MGGLLILGSLVVSVLLWGNLQNRFVWVALLTTAAMGAIGFYDDWLKLRTRRPLKIREKFLAQCVVGLAVGLYLVRYPSDGVTTQLSVPFVKEWIPDLGAWYILFAALIIVGASNAVNLTDGLDGLAMGPVIVAAVAFGVIAYVTGNARLSEYLFILKVRGAGELTVFCGALMGAGIGFLWFNSYPAEVFMGDVGSLSLGGAIGALAVLSKAELLLPFIGGLFVVEAVSVILQVGLVPPDRPTDLPHGAAPPPLRADRLARVQGRDPLLDPGGASWRSWRSRPSSSDDDDDARAPSRPPSSTPRGGGLGARRSPAAR